MDLLRRRRLNQALAKAIAFQDQGNHTAARNWAARLILTLADTFPGADEEVCRRAAEAKG